MSSSSIQSALVLKAMPAIRALARDTHRAHNPVRNLVSVEDLEQEGALGAVLAARRYKRSIGCFMTFAKGRICGQMVEPYRRRRHKETVFLTSPEKVPVETLESSRTSGYEEPGVVLLRQEYGGMLWKEVARLPYRESKVLRGLYYEGRKLNDVCQELGVCESRCSQLRRSGLAIVRRRLMARGVTSGIEMR